MIVTDHEQRWEEHWKRWDIPAPVFDFTGLRHRIVQQLKRVFEEYNEELEELLERFSGLLGLSPQNPPKVVGENSVHIPFMETRIAKRLLVMAPWEDWVTSLQCFLWSVGDLTASRLSASRASSGTDADEEGWRGGVSVLLAVEQAIKMSPGAPLAMTLTGDTALLYPRGAKFLDEGLVNDNLKWLGAHESAAKHFGKALSFYDEQARHGNLLDELRKSLEQLLRDVLGNRKSLEKQAPVLLPWLNKRGVHQQVVNLFRDLLDRFCQYQNDAVKHGEQWVPPEIEFMVYLTGTFMRMLLQLERAGSQETP